VPLAVLIPPGVGHGFYFPVASSLIYSVTDYWDADDELGCRWDDPELHVEWQAADPLLSERDQRAGGLREMINEYERRIATKAIGASA
jgi:dTDP-4-dehydrorhamnose 3,5-epimerase